MTGEVRLPGLRINVVSRLHTSCPARGTQWTRKACCSGTRLADPHDPVRGPRGSTARLPRAPQRTGGWGRPSGVGTSMYVLFIGGWCLGLTVNRLWPDADPGLLDDEREISGSYPDRDLPLANALGSVVKRLPDVLHLQVRQSIADVGGRHAVSDHVDDQQRGSSSSRVVVCAATVAHGDRWHTHLRKIGVHRFAAAVHSGESWFAEWGPSMRTPSS